MDRTTGKVAGSIAGQVATGLARGVAGRVTALPRRAKQAIITAGDAALVPLGLAGAVALQANELAARLPWPVGAALLLMALSALLTVALGIHRVQLKAYETRAFALSALHGLALALGAATIDGLSRQGTPVAAFVTFALLYPVLVGGARLAGLRLLLALYRSGRARAPVIIYGAGLTGQQLAAALSSDDTVRPVAFVDDAPSRQGTIVRGLDVHAPGRIAALARDSSARRVLLAMPQAPRARQAQIARRLKELGLQVQTLPSFAELAGTGTPLAQALRPLDPDAFLGRAPLEADLPSGTETYEGRVVLVSGAGGSIGSELCRRLLLCRPRRLVMLEMSELALYRIDQELAPLGREAGIEVVPVLGSAADPALVRRTLREAEVEVVLHAAAYKHVHMVEANPVAGVGNNVLATQVLAQAAEAAGVRTFILISSDKAVRPHNVMGASKRLSEIVVQDLASRADPARGGTVFAMVRFGNVLGSSGSVIPLFQEQIDRGGPVTLTDREVTRYFMTIPEAARLVLVAGSYARGGDLFVLDMGDPVPIHDLACRMIRAAGLTVRNEADPEGDIEIVLTGLRPGEKLHEELLIGGDHLPTAHPKILRVREAGLSEIEVAACLRDIRAAAAAGDPDAMRRVVARSVEEGGRLAARLLPAE
jgi:FlaA1/EpsC-like NDP-sugar epimerase